MAIEKVKILGAILELPAKKHCLFGQFGPIFAAHTQQTGQKVKKKVFNWQRFICTEVTSYKIHTLAGSSKTAPRILIFSIVLGAEYLSFVKSNATYAPTIFGYIILVLANVNSKDR